MTSYAHNSLDLDSEFTRWYNSEKESGRLDLRDFEPAAGGTADETSLFGLGRAGTYVCDSPIEGEEVFLGGRWGSLSPLPRALLLEKFQRLTARWRTDVRFLSDTNEICSHPAYQEIIGMGSPV